MKETIKKLNKKLNNLRNEIITTLENYIKKHGKQGVSILIPDPEGNMERVSVFLLDLEGAHTFDYKEPFPFNEIDTDSLLFFLEEIERAKEA